MHPLYTPLIEVVVNAIQAIEVCGQHQGEIHIRAIRSPQAELSSSLPDIHSFAVEDNGIGFTNENRDSFDTLYGDLKLKVGGKGFGRFTCLKYFDNVHVESVFRENGNFLRRTFCMGRENDIIVDEKITPANEKQAHTVVRLLELKEGKSIDKKLSTVARILVEKLLGSPRGGSCLITILMS